MTVALALALTLALMAVEMALMAGALVHM